ncbi:hypothetical protein [Streptomyces sp. BH105]|uniref:hypothetical protein n=1 Tax=Streptomyces sp. BH105 TaxID=3410408 RepID=UPI003CEA4770
MVNHAAIAGAWALSGCSDGDPAPVEAETPSDGPKPPRRVDPVTEEAERDAAALEGIAQVTGIDGDA